MIGQPGEDAAGQGSPAVTMGEAKQPGDLAFAIHIGKSVDVKRAERARSAQQPDYEPVRAFAALQFQRLQQQVSKREIARVDPHQAAIHFEANDNADGFRPGQADGDARDRFIEPQGREGLAGTAGQGHARPTQPVILDNDRR